MNAPPEAQASIRRSAPVIAGGVAGASVIALLAVSSVVAPALAGGATLATFLAWLGCLGGNALATWLTAWTTENLARFDGDDPDRERRRLEQLARDLIPTGSAVLWRTSGATSIIRIPNTTAQDVATAAEHLAGTLPPGVRETSTRGPSDGLWTPTGSVPDAILAEASTSPGWGKLASAEAARAAVLFLSGQDPATIVLDLRGVKSSDEERRYQKALAEVLDLIREGIQAA